MDSTISGQKRCFAALQDTPEQLPWLHLNLSRDLPAWLPDHRITMDSPTPSPAGTCYISQPWEVRAVGMGGNGRQDAYLPQSATSDPDNFV